jgi:hypothetical protein
VAVIVATAISVAVIVALDDIDNEAESTDAVGGADKDPT